MYPTPPTHTHEDGAWGTVELARFLALGVYAEEQMGRKVRERWTSLSSPCSTASARHTQKASPVPSAPSGTQQSWETLMNEHFQMVLPGLGCDSCIEDAN